MTDQKQASSSQAPASATTMEKKQGVKRPLELDSHGKPRFHGCAKHSEYEVVSKLGEGTFGEVYKAKSRKTGAIVAIKKILILNEKDGFPITSLREIKILKMLSHVNILTLNEMAVDRPRQQKGETRRKSTVHMVTPYMDHDLSGLLENPAVNLSEPQIKCYMLQLLEGVRYLHSKQILHRDMKAANLLINNRGILQIADFGLARHYSEKPPEEGRGNGVATRDYTTLVVTRWYRPPELLLQTRRYTPAIDIWGVGCVFGEMFVRKPILSGNSDVNQLQIIFDLMGSPTQDNMPGWDSLPGIAGVSTFKTRPSTLAQRFREQGSGVISLLEELLRLDPARRINAIDALDHPYFRTDPLPARPGDLPQYEASHELDRRRFRGQKAALPPAPAGGTVGMGANGTGGGDSWARGAGPPTNGQHWGNGSAPRHGPGYGSRPSGSGYDAQARATGPPHRNMHNDSRFSSSHQSRRPGGYEPAPNQAPSRSIPSWTRDGIPEKGLPPRPPPPEGHRGPDGAPDRGGHRHGLSGSSGQGSRGEPYVDTYIPNYSNAGSGPNHRVNGPRRDEEGRRDDRRDRDRRPGEPRDWGRGRSRSPLRDRDRDRDRDRIRDRDRDRGRDRDLYRR